METCPTGTFLSAAGNLQHCRIQGVNCPQGSIEDTAQVANRRATVLCLYSIAASSSTFSSSTGGSLVQPGHGEKENSIRQMMTSAKEQTPKKHDLQPAAGTLKAVCLPLCLKRRGCCCCCCVQEFNLAQPRTLSARFNFSCPNLPLLTFPGGLLTSLL